MSVQGNLWVPEYTEAQPFALFVRFEEDIYRQQRLVPQVVLDTKFANLGAAKAGFTKLIRYRYNEFGYRTPETNAVDEPLPEGDREFQVLNSRGQFEGFLRVSLVCLLDGGNYVEHLVLPAIR